MPKRTGTSPSKASPKKPKATSISIAQSDESEPQQPDEVEAQELQVETTPPKAKSNPEKQEKLILSVEILREEFCEIVNQLYETITEDQDDDDDEIVIDISTVQEFRLLYSRVADDEATERKTIIDQFFREYLLDPILAKGQPWNLFLELSIKLAREEITSPGVPIALLTDLVELSSLQECEVVFHFVEQRLSIWKETLFDSCKHSVLRLCNDLLRRLSKGTDTVFCGKILIFLSNYFPFSERSGLNIMSEFNTESLIGLNAADEDADAAAAEDGAAAAARPPVEKLQIVVDDKIETLFEGMEIDIPGLEEMVRKCQQESKKGMEIDYTLYVKFWALQDFFRNPNQCYNKLNWRTFVTYVSDVLQAFSSYKLDDTSIRKKKDKVIVQQQQIGNGSPMQLDVSMNSADSSSSNAAAAAAGETLCIPKLGDNTFFPKFLTNKRLFDLQLGDPTFRRNFLVQLLIVLQYLILPVKFKSDVQVLSEEQVEQVKRTEEQIYDQLALIPPNGPRFVENVMHIIKSEEGWNKWKNDGCPQFKKPAPSAAHPVDLKDDLTDDVFNGDKEEGLIPPTQEDGIKFISKAKERRDIGDIICEATLKKRFLLGNNELTRLWNISPDNLEACRAKERDFTPSIETFFFEAMKELDLKEISPLPAKDLKPKKILGNASFGWRALRLLARRSPFFFQMHPGSPIHPLQNYLEYVLKRIAAEINIPASLNQLNDGNMNEQDMDGKDDDANDAEMDQEAEEDEDEMINNANNGRDAEPEEEGEIDNEKLRNLTEEEQINLGAALGIEWKKLAGRLGFKKDEIDYFETEKKESAASWMLKMWTEQDGEDATLADLMYTIEGLGLKERAEKVIKFNPVAT